LSANRAFTPDGKRVLFVRDYYDHAAIFVMNADGTGVTQLTTTQVAVLDQFPIAFGKQITFNRFEDGSYWIYIMNADGTGLTRLPQTAGGVYPAPSPKGGRIAFSRGGDIYLVDVTTGGLTNLTNSPVSEQDPAYSPSGKQIAFARSGSDGGIFVMNDDGTAVTRITTNTSNAHDTKPRWSPDGKRIAFTSTRDGSYGIYTINADGTGLTDLTRAPLTQEYLSAWARQ